MLPESHAGCRKDTVHVVTQQQASNLLEDEDQTVGHQYLLQVVTLVEEAEERPLEEVAKDHGEQ